MKILLTLILWVYSSIAIACDCDWLGDFFEATQKSNPHLIIKGRIVSKITDREGFQMKMNVEIIKTLRGKSSKKNLVIWGDQGADCRPYISRFEIGETYYFALHTYKDDYELIICGEHFVKVVGDCVKSDIRVRANLNIIGDLSEREFIELIKK